MNNVGWRDVILVLAAMAGVYLVLSVMRIFQIGGKRRDQAKQELSRIFSAWEPYSQSEAQKSQPASEASKQDFPDERALSDVEVELLRLRSENDHLREELAGLTQEVARLKATK